MWLIAEERQLYVNYFHGSIDVLEDQFLKPFEEQLNRLIGLQLDMSALNASPKIPATKVRFNDLGKMPMFIND